MSRQILWNKNELPELISMIMCYLYYTFYVLFKQQLKRCLFFEAVSIWNKMLYLLIALGNKRKAFNFTNLLYINGQKFKSKNHARRSVLCEKKWNSYQCDKNFDLIIFHTSTIITLFLSFQIHRFIRVYLNENWSKEIIQIVCTSIN